MFSYFYDMLCFGAICRKNSIKQVILGFASGRCNLHSRNSKLAINDFKRVSLLIKCIVLV